MALAMFDDCTDCRTSPLKTQGGEFFSFLFEYVNSVDVPYPSAMTNPEPSFPNSAVSAVVEAVDPIAKAVQPIVEAVKPYNAAKIVSESGLVLRTLRQRRTLRKTEKSKGSVAAKKSASSFAGDAFKPARGRGRQAQLKKMSNKEKAAEAAWRLEKNRIAARECRERRKEHFAELQEQLGAYEKQNLEQQQVIDKLNAEIATLMAEVAARR